VAEPERLVVIGKIVRAHGLRGEVRVAPLTDDPERFERVTECVLWDTARDLREPRRITAVRGSAHTMLVALSDCETPEAAQALAGRLIAIPEREALPLPAGTFYPWQLEGATVVTEDGREVGRMAGIERGAAQDLWVVRDGSREHLIPAVADIVIDVDVAGRRVVIRPPDGLLEL
jgi:16S rRNA processing protein RimM